MGKLTSAPYSMPWLNVEKEDKVTIAITRDCIIIIIIIHSDELTKCKKGEE
jgi:hypothetical protein